MKLVVIVIACVLVGSVSGCISARVDARNASEEWAEVGKSWAEAFKEQGQAR